MKITGKLIRVKPKDHQEWTVKPKDEYMAEIEVESVEEKLYCDLYSPKNPKLPNKIAGFQDNDKYPMLNMVINAINKLIDYLRWKDPNWR